MKVFAVVFLSSVAFAADPPSCLIIRHASAAHQFLVSGANWQYVSGEFPKGMKWKSNITDRYVRKIKDAGWRVVTVPTNYTASDLEFAQKQCSAEPADQEKKP